MLSMVLDGDGEQKHSLENLSIFYPFYSYLFHSICKNISSAYINKKVELKSN